MLLRSQATIFHLQYYYTCYFWFTIKKTYLLRQKHSNNMELTVTYQVVQDLQFSHDHKHLRDGYCAFVDVEQ